MLSFKSTIPFLRVAFRGSNGYFSRLRFFIPDPSPVKQYLGERELINSFNIKYSDGLISSKNASTPPRRLYISVVHSFSLYCFLSYTFCRPTVVEPTL